MRKWEPVGAVAPKTDADELTRGWRVLVASMLGLGLGSSALLFYSMGLFAIPLQNAIGLTRTQLGVGTLLATLAASLAAPFVGTLVDKLGVRRVAIPSAALLAAGFIAIAFGAKSVLLFLILQTLVAALSAGTGPVSFTRAISHAFVVRRGLALGLGLTGIGLSAAVTPFFIARAIAAGGWPAGYLFLAALAFAGVLTATLLPGTKATSSSDHARGQASGMEPGSALRSPAFAALTLAFVLQSLSFGGLLPHFVPLLIDSGMGVMKAASYAGLIGIAVIGSRLIVGWLTDRLFAPWIAAATCMVCAGGCALLLIDPSLFAPAAALALGCAMGAEVNLIGYCTARYFGMKAYGRIYGMIYGAFLTGSGLGPVWVGAIRDATGSYRLAVALAVAGLIVAAIAFLRSPRYPDPSIAAIA